MAKSGIKLKFDASGLTANQFKAYQAAASQTDIDGMSEIFAQCCVKCPESWGEPKVADTFAERPYGEFIEVNEQFKAALNGSKSKHATFDIDYDLHTINARDFSNRLIRPLQRSDFQTVAEFFAECITRCPESWGEPDDPETYLNLVYYTEFQPLAKQIEIGEREKK